jgi:amino-acid N-acetyltransferase
MKEETAATESDITIEPAGAADKAAVWQLLQACELPTEGLAEHWAAALVAWQRSAVVGSAALELYGEYALLRSVAVAAGHRGGGLGVKLAEAALDLARQHGVIEVYLLTETAAEFFPKLGFDAVSRDQVPEAVRASVEFTSACPDTALAMRLRMAP